MSFSASESVPASDRVRAEWANRTEAEYRSAALVHNITLWLIQAGASPDLIRDGLRITDDELVHAEMSHEVFAAAGGTAPPNIDREQLQLPRDLERPLELDLATYGVQIFCLGETVAVPLFAHLRDACTVPVARAALDRILVDEVRHRQFGWDLLDQLLGLPDEMADVLREHIAQELPHQFAELELSYGLAEAAAAADESSAPGPETLDTSDTSDTLHTLDDSERRWGLAPPTEYATILHETFVTDYQPRFAERGIDALPAWEHRGAILERMLAAN